MNEEKLNSLLEDALDDLLVQDEPKPEGDTAEEDKLKVTGGKEDFSSQEETCRAGTSVQRKQQGGSNKKPKRKTKQAANSSPLIDEEEMNKFFESMAKQLGDMKIEPEEAQSKINETVPQIFDLMQNLLSKELLYPALKDLSPKFDEWLEKNSQKLSAKEAERFKEQKSIIDEIVEVFDDESLDNQQRFERNLDLMEKMQSLGSPPEELTVPGGPDKCSIM